MARPEGLEPPTYSSGGWRSIQLSYGRAPMLTVYQGAGTLSRWARCLSQIFLVYLAPTWKLPAAPCAAAFGATQTSNVPGGTTHFMFGSYAPRSRAFTVKVTVLFSPGCSATRWKPFSSRTRGELGATRS